MRLIRIDNPLRPPIRKTLGKFRKVDIRAMPLRGYMARDIRVMPLRGNHIGIVGLRGNHIVR